MLNRYAYWCLAGAVAALLLAGGACSSPSDRPEADDAPLYLTTIPPFRAILAPVVGTRGTVEVLLETGGSPHTYEPRPSDLRHAQSSTLLMYGAPHLDGWAAELTAPERVALMDLVPATEHLAWDTAEESADHGHAGAADPHFWTDPMAVRAMLPALADTLCHADPAGCTTYRANADSLASALVALDAEIQSLMEPVGHVPVLLAQPFFRYFMQRYGPELAGIIEPQPAKEPTPRALQALIRTARERRVRAILVQEQLPARSAQAVAEAAGVPLLRLDPIGGAAGRRTYGEWLRYNAQMLHDALAPSPSNP